MSSFTHSLQLLLLLPLYTPLTSPSHLQISTGRPTLNHPQLQKSKPLQSDICPTTFATLRKSVVYVPKRLYKSTLGFYASPHSVVYVPKRLQIHTEFLSFSDTLHVHLTIKRLLSPDQRQIQDLCSRLCRFSACIAHVSVP